jgi:flagellar biosynthesis chaperone FliJ
MRHGIRYPLQALKDIRGRELDAAHAALISAQAEVDAAQQRVARAEASLHDIEALLRECERDGILDLDRRRLAHAFLGECRARGDTLRQELRVRIGECRDALDTVTARKTALRSLERHEQRLSERAGIEFARADQREADDGWLALAMRRRRDTGSRA